MTNYKFDKELLKDVLEVEKDRLLDLIEENAEEGKALLKDVDVDWERLKQVEQIGNLGTYSVRTEEGELVGYALILADYHLHHIGKISAAVDTIFIKREHRRLALGYDFVQYLISEMKALNVDVFSISAKVDHTFNRLLKRIGFTPVDVVYAKILKDD